MRKIQSFKKMEQGQSGKFCGEKRFLLYFKEDPGKKNRVKAQKQKVLQDAKKITWAIKKDR